MPPAIFQYSGSIGPHCTTVMLADLGLWCLHMLVDYYSLDVWLVALFSRSLISDG